jgi:hypothetical protein
MPLLSGLKPRNGKPGFEAISHVNLLNLHTKLYLDEQYQITKNLVSKPVTPYMVMMGSVKMFMDIVINCQ